MIPDAVQIDVTYEAAALANDIKDGNPCASMHLARLIENDHRGVFLPFAEALAARLRDYLERWAELGVTDPETTLADELYHLLKLTAVDWDGLPCAGRPGEEA
jgi:hypothetical protein